MAYRNGIPTGRFLGKISSGPGSVNGPAIVTPGGSKTSGDYSRHAFSYVVPASEPQPGTTVMMRLLNEETMNLRASPEAAWETWRRCGPPIS